MAVPKRKVSRSRKGMRNSHTALKKIVSFVEKDGKMYLNHKVHIRDLKPKKIKETKE